MLRTFFTKIKKEWEYLNWGRAVVITLAKQYVSDEPNCTLRILDLGSGRGDDLLNLQKAFHPREIALFGVESHLPYAQLCREKGIHVIPANIEHETLPLDDRSMDLVVANQIIEHTKEIFWIFSEISRVLKPGGIVIVGVPNLASLHNRLLLMAGKQPTSIELLGPHVRGITKGSFKNFIMSDGYFEFLRVQGSNFYPFPAVVSKGLARLFPTLSVSLFFCCRRTSKEGRFIDVLKTRFYETEFFKGTIA